MRATPASIRAGRSLAGHRRGHFIAAVAEAMRRILVENARRKQTEKRDWGHARLSAGPSPS